MGRNYKMMPWEVDYSDYNNAIHGSKIAYANQRTAESKIDGLKAVIKEECAIEYNIPWDNFIRDEDGQRIDTVNTFCNGNAQMLQYQAQGLEAVVAYLEQGKSVQMLGKDNKPHSVTVQNGYYVFDENPIPDLFIPKAPSLLSRIESIFTKVKEVEDYKAAKKAYDNRKEFEDTVKDIAAEKDKQVWQYGY